MHDVPETLARVDGVGGEVVVRRRECADGPVHELIVNGTFLMDTAETSTERLLATTLLERHPAPARILVGGLGFGFTAGALLDDRRVECVDVVEVEPALVRLLRDGVVPGADAVFADPRVHVVVDDIVHVLASCPPAHYDAVLLDVDNGPDFLVHAGNAEVYQPRMLNVAARTLRPGGVLAVWSAAPSTALSAALAQHVGRVDQVDRTVQREGRDVDYHVYVAQLPALPPASGSP